MALAYRFTTPSVPEHRVPMPRRGSINRLWGRIKTDQGLTLIKAGGLYRTVQYPDPDVDYLDAERVYLGGHVYIVDPAEAQDLTDAGYGQWLQEANVFGTGLYSDGRFGGVL